MAPSRPTRAPPRPSLIGAKGPGLFVIIPVVDRMVRLSLRTVTMDVPPQNVITKDNVTVRVNAVTYFNVVDPNRSVVAIEDHIKGTSQIAQTSDGGDQPGAAHPDPPAVRRRANRSAAVCWTSSRTRLAQDVPRV
jgi:hypothetical protein